MAKWLCTFLLILTPVFAFASRVSEHNISTIPLPPSAVLVYEQIIIPWLHTEFKRDISDEMVSIKRKLLLSELYRYEVIDGQTRYSVHIEYAVRTKDLISKYEFAGVRAQEIVFWVENKQVIDYFPFNEYTLEAILI
ncbi:MAG: hypothetical protein HY026_02740 [Deltaproteobacteria bacterium]|nr:hypothetical protein [Deltaproteobacteria bacterium]